MFSPFAKTFKSSFTRITFPNARSFSSSSNLLHKRATGPVIPSTSIKVFRTISALRQWRRQQLLDHRTVGLVPTMGALHSGHASLVRLAASQTSLVVVTIYVNPTQFGVTEDLDSYPKTWDADCKILRDLDRDIAEDGANMGRIAAVFAPDTKEMYPSEGNKGPSQEIDGKGSFVTITPVGEKLEGKTRPTFFRGVATICMKLFNIVQPEKVFFGQKDVQQTVVIKKLVKDFHLNTDVIIGATQRESDGLALSSRNVYLGTRRRNVATVLSKALKVAETGYLRGKRTRDELLGPAHELAKLMLIEQFQMKPEERVNYEVDYISLADPDTMEELDVVDDTRGAILSGAVKMLPVEEPQDGEDLGAAGGPAVRLIDNIILPAAAMKAAN
ncbi:nucleotidylyl transferase-1 [Coleophoma cylindrospora]|uniref:Pantoate--beta-alanine ligase n=1 Tax=Coleophoma cylindrospora TaxID=1849047 RepID=A0A3D8R5X7_9HELO|nr:nucleotidylyl transferase-1 [Coleophoma cylindrospora]